MKFTTAGDMMKEEHRMYPEIDENNVGDYFRFVPNPEDPNDSQYCMEIVDVPKFDGTIFKFLQVQFGEEYEDGTADVNFTYDIKYVPENLPEFVEEDKTFFEEFLSKILLWIITQHLNKEVNENEQN